MSSDYASFKRKRQLLANKIVKEHFEITLYVDRNINYLWYMYYKGSKKGEYRDFILAVELNLLNQLGTITEEEKLNLKAMLTSEDLDNSYIAVMAIDNLRKERIKKHGEWNTKLEISDEFEDIKNNYVDFIHNYNLDKL